MKPEPDYIHKLLYRPEISNKRARKRIKRGFLHVKNAKEEGSRS